MNPARYPFLAALTLSLALPVAGLGASAVPADDAAPRSNLRYDFDYPDLNYGSAPATNAIAQLQKRIDSGALHLKNEGPRGYLDSLLKALDIDPSSQVLIYSKTSLQTDRIDVATPRAVYFNDHTYVASVHGSPFIEIATYDPKLGVMFYGLTSDATKPARFSRETGRCLTCHDTYSMLGGGTPRVVVTSAPVIQPDGTPPPETSGSTTDRSPIAERWGGWYVTGQTGNQKHLGNLPLDDPRRLPPGPLASAPRNLRSVAKLFDTSTYLRDTSDVVALMVLEHQTNVQNLMTRASYKGRTALARMAGEAAEPKRWHDLPAPLQKSFVPLVEPLAQALLMEGVVGLEEPMASSSAYDTWFQAQGPRDAQGRSLRELDLNRTVFRYPLSYLLYSEAFDALPPYFKDYVYSRIERSVQEGGMSADEQAARRTAVAILLATKPDFAAHAQREQHPTAADGG
jgi:hypothetical protein